MITLNYNPRCKNNNYCVDEYPVKKDGEYIPLHCLICENDFVFNKNLNSYMYRTYKAIVKQSCNVTQGDAYMFQSRTREQFKVYFGALFHCEGIAKFNILYSIMVKREFAEQQKRMFETNNQIIPQAVELWVSPKVKTLSPTLNKHFNDVIVPFVELLEIPIVEKNSFKELFYQPHEQYQTLGSFMNLQKELLNSL